jgi:hypothetical protein
MRDGLEARKHRLELRLVRLDDRSASMKSQTLRLDKLPQLIVDCWIRLAHDGPVYCVVTRDGDSSATLNEMVANCS